jgi:hypothetical protein
MRPNPFIKAQLGHGAEVFEELARQWGIDAVNFNP